MNELELTYLPYSLKFKVPFVTSKVIMKERKGFIIEVTDSSGVKGIGDIAPLTEFGMESCETAEEQLKHIRLKIELRENIRKSITDFLTPYDNYPALRHGLEQAILSFICNKTKLKLNELLELNLAKEININAVIGFLPPKDSAKLAKDFVNEGYSTIKVKLGRENFAEDEAVINEIRNAVNESVKLRVDINGKWNLNEAIDNLNKLEKYNIEYAEEPVSGFEKFIDLSKETNVALAPDESLRNKDDAIAFIDSNIISFLILKPMMLGGLISVLELSQLAKSKNITPVITSSFESTVGRVNAVIAAAAANTETAHGLATAKYFEKDLIEDPFQIVKGKIKL